MLEAPPIIARRLLGPQTRPVGAWERALASVPGLIHWWPLDEPSATFKDRIGTWHGSANGTPGVSPVIPGLVPYSRSKGAFAGNGTSRVSYGTNGVAPPFTFLCWYRCGSDANTALLGNWGGSPNTGAMIYVNSSLQVVGYVGATFFAGASVSDGKLHFIAFTVSGTSGVMYVDGVATAGTVGTYGAPSRLFETNNYNNSTGAYGSGTIAHVAVVNRALSAAEVQALYRAGRADPSIVRDQLVLYPLHDTYINDGSPTTNNDLSTNILIGQTAGFRRRILMTFDGRRIRQIADLKTATLRLTVDSRNDNIGGQFWAVRCLRKYVKNEVTWNIWKAGANWTTAGAVGEWTDFEGRNYCYVINSTGASLTASIDLDITPIIRRFLDQRAPLNIQPWPSNDDLRLILGGGTGGTIGFGALESTTPSKRPKLIIR